MKHLITLIIAFFIYSCNNTDNRMNEIIDNTYVISDTAHFCNIAVQAFRLSYEVWNNVDTVYYCITYPPVKDETIKSEYFNKSDKRYIKEETEKAFNKWTIHVGIPVKEIEDPSKANINIRWQFIEIDGVGGMYALADLPTKKGAILRMDLADMWKIVKNRDPMFPKIMLHELGHIYAGLRHDEYNDGVMTSKGIHNELQLDDICGARINYKRYSSFLYKGKEFVFLNYSKGDNYITTNFKIKEFFTKCSKDYEGDFINIDVVNSIQEIRNYYGVPIKILSTNRDFKCNKNAGGATNSRHLNKYKDAIDWKFVGSKASKTQNKYESDINNNREILKILVKNKVRGLGTYPYGYGTNHIDTRPVVLGNKIFNGTHLIVWGEFTKSTAWYSPEEEFSKHD